MRLPERVGDRIAGTGDPGVDDGGGGPVLKARRGVETMQRLARAGQPEAECGQETRDENERKDHNTRDARERRKHEPQPGP